MVIFTLVGVSLHFKSPIGFFLLNILSSLSNYDTEISMYIFYKVDVKSRYEDRPSFQLRRVGPARLRAGHRCPSCVAETR